MLELENISKVYKMPENEVVALNNLSIIFRNKEFVSILGPSGCGKTTTLNIVGGLDKYSSGELKINGISTKDYKDKDWDNYRNHKVGFVFQSYNLIPHQTVGQNIELSLILGGLSKSQRKQKVLDVLKKVGLEDKYHSKPNQLSGGQMQRVSIARALINDPEIVLADEPTGALDSKTSLQIMDLLKEVSKDRLVIMVTHNPELADNYSTRIVKLQDGKLVSDSNPVTEKEYLELKKEDEKILNSNIVEIKDKKGNVKKKKIKEKTSMSLLTALSLSFKNLLSKKGRTILVSFAGSIGIIGISLVLALSNGFQSYIDKVEEDTLTTYPIEISAKGMDMTSIMMSAMMSSVNQNGKADDDAVYSSDVLTSMMGDISRQLSINDTQGFYNYLQNPDNFDKIKDYVNDIQYTYNLPLNITTQNGKVVEPNSTAIMDIIINYSVAYLESKANVTVEEDGIIYTITSNDSTDFTVTDSYLGGYAETLKNTGECKIPVNEFANIVSGVIGVDSTSMTALLQSSMSYTSEMLSNDELIKSQYEILSGEWNNSANEIVLVLDDEGRLSDYYMYALGFVDKQELKDMLKSQFTDEPYSLRVDFENIIGQTYKINIPTDYYFEDNDGTLQDIRKVEDFSNFPHELQYYLSEVSNNAEMVTITGIVRIKETTTNGALKEGLNYSKDLTEKLIQKYNNSSAVQSNIEGISLIKIDTPASINIYIKDFECREAVINFINDYNKNAEEGKQISYNDLVGTIMSSVTTIINAITYVLVGFVSVSLVVSSIMIGIITYISVLERRKEIGVLRSIGASKRDIKHVFSSEALIIGLTAGVLGIAVTLLLCIPINLILKSFTGISGVASLPVLAGIILILISMALTFIAGLIPAKIASKKDPVVALRSE